MDIYISLIAIFGVSFITVFLLAAKFIRKAKEKGYVTHDMYKKDTPLIPTKGGLVILAGMMVSLILAQFLAPDVENLLIFYFIVITFGVYGLVDDLFNVGRTSKIFLPFFLVLPIAQLNIDTSLWIISGEIELGIYYSFIIAPLYVMVVANLVNMHSGYNGLASGLSTIVLIFIAVNAYISQGIGSLFYVMPILGAMLAFWYYNKYPSRIFEGNTGALMFGAAMGGLIILNNMEIFGLIILTPHIINFLMYVVWRLKKLGDVKFGVLRDDGTIKVPNPWTLKWTLPYYFRLTEQQGTYVMYGLTIMFGIIGVLVDYYLKHCNF